MISIKSCYRGSYIKTELRCANSIYNTITPHVQICCQRLAWDTKVLKRSCARITNIHLDSVDQIHEFEDLLAQTMIKTDKDKIDLIDVRIGQHGNELIKVLENNQFAKVDQLVIYLSKNPPYFEKKDSEFEFSYQWPNKTQVNQMLDFGMKSFMYSRFYQDEHITKDLADHFYLKLLETILNKPTNIVVTAKDKSGRVVGFCVGGPDEGLGLLWMISVNADHVKKGIASQLLVNFLNLMHKKFSMVEIGTQENNMEANLLYKKFKLPVVAKVATFHRWRKND